MTPKNYREFCAIERSDKPLTRTVKTDDLTDMANECFDMPFDGVCKFYPFNVPQLPDYRILAIVGKSGSGKSTKYPRANEIVGQLGFDGIAEYSYENLKKKLQIIWVVTFSKWLLI